MTRFPWMVLLACMAACPARSPTPEKSCPTWDAGVRPRVGSKSTTGLLTAPVCGLLVNGGAEMGELCGWTSHTGSFKASQVRERLLPAPWEQQWMFFAGSADISRMYQDVDVRWAAKELHSTMVYAHLSAQVRGWSIDDEAFLELEALGRPGVLATAVTPALKHNMWMRRSLHLALPPDTTTVRVWLMGVRHDGGDADAYFDDVNLCVDTQAPPGEEELVIPPYLTWMTQHEVSIQWVSSNPGIGGVSYGSTEELGLSQQETTRSTHHRVRLTGLQPGTRYFYRIEGLAYPGTLHSFRTAPAQPEPFTFVVWGDNQDGTEVFTPLVRRMAEFQPAFMVSAGDNVSTSTDDMFHNQLLLLLSPVAPSIPLVLAPGNHDAWEDTELTWFQTHVHQAGLCFGWSWANVHFLVINSNRALPDPSTTRCVDGVLASPEFQHADFRVAVFHHPPRVEYWKGGGVDGEPWVRQRLEPRLSAAGVDVVFNGHSHLYAYGPPESTGGVTWVTTGGGGGGLEGPEDLVRDWPEIQVIHLRHHFMLVRVDGSIMDVRAVSNQGEVLHAFRLTSRTGR